jgi:riboflavin synthase
MKMFTGIVERVGTVTGIARRSGGISLRIESGKWESLPAPGESVSVAGVCLTLTSVETASFTCDVLKETLEKSTLGTRRTGDRINLERALRAGDRIGGHFVTGHVDGIGRVVAVRRVGDDHAVEIACPAALMEGIVLKGSVACDGVSLTIAEANAKSFCVHVIPTTWTGTTLGHIRAGWFVNIETDLLGKHVRRTLERTRTSGVTVEKLRDAGFPA